jgi:hypothetical protein
MPQVTSAAFAPYLPTRPATVFALPPQWPFMAGAAAVGTVWLWTARWGAFATGLLERRSVDIAPAAEPATPLLADMRPIATVEPQLPAVIEPPAPPKARKPRTSTAKPH